MVFLFIFIIFIIINIVAIFSKITIEINNLKITISKKTHNVNDDFKITIKLIFFNRITILRKVYNKNKINKINKKLKINNKIKNIKIQKVIDEFKENKKPNSKILKIFIKDMFEIKDINLKIIFGTKNASITAICVGIISTIIPIVLRYKIKKEKSQKFCVIPLYNNDNIININISGIFRIKLIHIINIIYIFINKKGENKYECASNRKSYDYSYEQYSRYD